MFTTSIHNMVIQKGIREGQPLTTKMVFCDGSSEPHFLKSDVISAIEWCRHIFHLTIHKHNQLKFIDLILSEGFEDIYKK